jgi:protein-L-isoaspartate(D-aspartate) O-methyltransferase
VDLDAARTRLLGSLRHGIRDKRVLSAISSVPRELFISPDYYYAAYEDMPLSIGFGQTISHP